MNERRHHRRRFNRYDQTRNVETDMTPVDLRTARLKLGLSQAELGRLLEVIRMRRYWVRHHEPLDLPTLEQHDVPADHFYWNDHQVSIVDEETYNAWLAGNGPQDTNCIAYGPGDWQSVKWVDTSVVNKAHLDEIDDWLERHGQ